jgi:serine/threonine-protein kinase
MAALAGLGVLAVVALVVGLILTNQRPSGPPDVSVPNVIGQSQTQAEAALRKVGLVPQTGASVKTSACNKNKVADQNPKEGGTVKQGGTVVINVCTGPDQVQVPDLSDTNRDAAERLLKGAKLEAKFDEVDDERPEGTVIDWSPKDKPVPPGTVVTVKISKGNLVPVPNVVGSSEETARGILRTAGFKVRTTEVPVPAGTPAEVTEQDPPANQKRPKGSTVTIVVAVPEEPVPDPSGSSEPPDGDGEGT